IFFFFFSSRRRHTRSYGDWSSDVCSSDLWGHECRIAGGHEWDTWNNVKQHWVPTGIPCNPISGAWNHLVLSVQRTSGNKLIFHSITLNGKTAVLDRYDAPGPRKNWYGVTVN